MKEFFGVLLGAAGVIGSLGVGIYFLIHVLHLMMWRKKPFTYGHMIGETTETTVTTTVWSDGWVDKDVSTISHYFYQYLVNGRSYQTGKVYSSGEPLIHIFYNPENPESYYAHVIGEENTLTSIALVLAAGFCVGNILLGEGIGAAIFDALLTSFVLYLPTIIALLIYIPNKIPDETSEEKEKRVRKAYGVDENPLRELDPSQYEAYFRKAARERDLQKDGTWLNTTGIQVLNAWNAIEAQIAGFDNIKPKKTVSETKKDCLVHYPYIFVAIILVYMVISWTILKPFADGSTGIMALITGNVNAGITFLFLAAVSAIVDLAVSLPRIPAVQSAWDNYNRQTQHLIAEKQKCEPAYKYLCKMIPERYLSVQEITHVLWLCAHGGARSIEEAVFIHDQENVKPPQYN